RRRRPGIRRLPGDARRTPGPHRGSPRRVTESIKHEQETRMNRIVMTALVATAAIALAGCGATASAGSSSARPAASASPRFGGRNGASGELVQMNGTTLVVNSQTGDVTVLYTGAPTFQRTRT